MTFRQGGNSGRQHAGSRIPEYGNERTRDALPGDDRRAGGISRDCFLLVLAGLADVFTVARCVVAGLGLVGVGRGG